MVAEAGFRNSSGTPKVVFMNSSGAAKIVPRNSSDEAEEVARTSNRAAKIPLGPAFGGPKVLVYIFIYIYIYMCSFYRIVYILVQCKYNVYTLYSSIF